jgi:hypothetical protein
MAKDWLPHAYAALLEMCYMWEEVLTAPVRAALGIPADVWTEYLQRRATLEEWYAKLKDKAQHTPIVTVECETAREALMAQMRFIHDRYLFTPPLTPAQWVGLGLKLPDATPSEIDAPKDAPEVEASSPHHRMVRFDIKAKGAKRHGIPEKVHGLELRHTISDTEPTSIKEFTNSEFATKSPLEILFEETDRGKKLYFIARWKTEANKKSLWTDIMFVYIP